MRRADADARDRAEPVAPTQGRPNVIDPDIDLHDPAQRAETRPREWDLLAAMSAGGIAGAEARYGVSAALPHPPGGFAWATVLVNASGCLLIGVLMVVLLEIASPHRLWRPFLGVGVLGGYTTYSTFAVDAEQLIRQHRPALALGYVALTFVACLLAVGIGVAGTRLLAPARRTAPDPEVVCG